MKDAILLFAAIIIVFAVIFSGLRYFVKKSYEVPPDTNNQQKFEKRVKYQNDMDDRQQQYDDFMQQREQMTSDLKSDGVNNPDDMQDKYRDNMRQLKQRMKDMRRR